MGKFVQGIHALDGRIVGLATIWNSHTADIGGHPVYGLLNTLYDSHSPDDCLLCAQGIPIEYVPY